MCEPQDTQVLLVNEYEKRVFNSGRGVVTFFTKTKFAQDFTIRVINEKLSSQGITARGPRSEPRPNLHVEFPSVLTRVQAKPVDIIKEAILMNAKIDCNPIIIAERPNPKSQGRTISCLLPVDKLGQLQTWARTNNAKKLALFTESLPFWTTKKIDPTVVTPKVDSDQQVAASIIATENNEEEIIEVTDIPEGAQSDFSTTEMEVADSTPVEVHIQISEESSKNKVEETAEVTDFVEVTDSVVAQCAITNNLGATKVKATKVAKAKSADKKGTSLTSQNSIAKNRPRRACTLKSTSLGQPMVEASRKILMDSLVSQKRMSDFFPKK